MPLTSRQIPCPACGHEHLWLECDWCDCTSHVQTGIYEEST